jgi:hypothetical protein
VTILKALFYLLAGGIAAGLALTVYLLAVAWVVKRMGGDPRNPWVPISAIAALSVVASHWI